MTRYFCNSTRHCMRWSGQCSASYARLSSVGAFYIALFPVSIKKATIMTVSWWVHWYSSKRIQCRFCQHSCQVCEHDHTQERLKKVFALWMYEQYDAARSQLSRRRTTDRSCASYRGNRIPLLLSSLTTLSQHKAGRGLQDNGAPVTATDAGRMSG